MDPTETTDDKKMITGIGLWLVILSVISLLLMPIVIYLYKHNTLIMTNNPGNMGAWGDFFNPFIGLINVILLVYITFEVRRVDLHREEDKERLEDKRLEQSLDVQLRITIGQMRNEKAMEITKLFDSYHFSEQPNELFADSEKLKEVQKTFQLFILNNDYLFDEFFMDGVIKANVEKLLDIMLKLSRSKAILSNIKQRRKEAEKQIKFIEEKLKEMTTSTEIPSVHPDKLKAEIVQHQKKFKEANTVCFVEEDLMRSYTKDYITMKNDFVKGVNQFIINDLKKK